jgi:hypothetical protein
MESFYGWVGIIIREKGVPVNQFGQGRQSGRCMLCITLIPLFVSTRIMGDFESGINYL